MMRFLLAIILSGCLFDIHAITVGSDSAVTRFNAQQILNFGDRVAGFAALQGGLALADNLTTATFDSVFPVSGTIDLAAGTLILNQDIIFKDVSNFLTLGNVTGNNHIMELAVSMTNIPLMTPLNFDNCLITLLTTATQTAVVNTVSWTYDDAYVAEGLNTGGGNELKIYSFDGTSLTLTATFKIGSNVNAIDWHPYQYYLAVGSNSNPQLQTFAFTGTVFEPLTAVNFGAPVTAVRYHPTGNYLAVGAYGLNAKVYQVNSNGTLNTATAVTMPLTGTGNVLPQALDWDATGSYLAASLDMTAPAQSVKVFQLLASPFSLVNTGATTPVTATPIPGLSWNPYYQNLLGLAFDINPVLRVYKFTGAALNAYAISSGTPFSTVMNTMHWRRGGECMAQGTSVWPGGAQLQTWEFHNTAAITAASQITTFTTVSGIRWAHAGEYLAVGTNAWGLQIYEANNQLNSYCVTFSDLKVVMDCDVNLQNCCILFGGNSVINGQGMVLNLAPTCTILVDHTASLLLKDVTITGVSGNQISAVDGTSTYSFQDVMMFLDGNYSFTVGRFDVIQTLEISGPGYVFAYNTDQVSTISSNAALILDAGLTFSYDPRNASPTSLRFSDRTSQLLLNSATLRTTSVGWYLTKGYLGVDGHSYLYAESSSPGTGFRFGDGANSINDLFIELWPAATLQVLSGIVEDENV